jgi:hypothetical protein
VVNSRLTDKGLAVLSDTPPLMDGEFMQRYEMLDMNERSRILTSLQHVARLMDTEEVDPRPPTGYDRFSVD